jgi:Xaa-Pro aminopeptidase
MSYGHGTGHGIGSYLCVHEGPQSLSPVTGNRQPILPGMFLTIEPGFYQEGRYGIRIENLAVVAVDAALSTESETFLKLEIVTRCPVDRRLIETAMLDEGEIAWLDGFHADVARALEPLVEGEVKSWLAAATAPLERSR